MPGTRNQRQIANRNSGASTHILGTKDILRAYFAHHRRMAVETLGNMLSTPLTSLMTWLVIGIALALPAFLYILLVNLGNFAGGWDGKPRISLYLRGEITEEAGIRLSREIGDQPGITGIKYISEANALMEFEERAGFRNVLDSLPENPLPAVIEVIMDAATAADVRHKVSLLEARPEVESSSIDLEWMERLFSLVILGERFVTALAVFLGLGVLLAIGNTVRLSIENRRSEIEIVKLVGGTDRFVRRPFLYLGFWYGLGGAATSWLMVQVSLLFLAPPIRNLMQSYHDDFSISGLGIAETAALLVVGAFLGVLGATLAVGRHLHQIEPR